MEAHIGYVVYYSVIIFTWGMIAGMWLCYFIDRRSRKHEENLDDKR